MSIGFGSRHSLAARLTLGLALISLVVFPVVGSLLYRTLARQMATAEQQEIEGKADIVRHFLEEVRQPGDLLSLRHHLDDVLIGHGRLRLWLIAEDGTLLYGGTERPRTQRHGEGLIIWREDGVPLRGEALRLEAGQVVPAGELLIGYDSRERHQWLASYRQAVLAVCGLGLLLTVTLSSWITRRELRPIVRLSREAAALSTDALSERLSAHGIAVELRVLVDSFNRVLDRVEMTYRQLESFNADVAHELRTPLATLVTGLEVTLARRRANEEMKEALQESLEGLNEMAGMVNDMLFLARADRNMALEETEPVDVGEQSEVAARALSGLLSERYQRLQVEGAGRAMANPALLRRAVSNLVANAVRFGASGSTITIAIETTQPRVRVTVRNMGEAIAPEVLPRIFERFVRGDTARSGQSHHGLGLAIVGAVARLHGGETFARSQNGITEIGFTLRAAEGGEPSSMELQ